MKSIKSHLCALLLNVPLIASCQTTEVSIEEHAASSTQAPHARIIFLAGPDSHAPGAHEHRAGSELLATALRERQPGFETVNVYGGWPKDEALFEGADAVVMYCDGGKKHLINNHLQAFNRLLEKGVGIVALHYCVEVPKDSPSSKAMMEATGGYFETHWSVNPHWEAHFTALPDHPISAGVKPFSQLDEWYFNMRFMPRGVTPILSAIPPTATMARANGPHSGNDAVRTMVTQRVPQVTAWAYERQDGGRGFGYTGGHFHENWQNINARTLVLNAIEWTAKAR
ncbi:MAG: ThuA domain-containing protein [Halioglobus sp.]